MGRALLILGLFGLLLVDLSFAKKKTKDRRQRKESRSDEDQEGATEDNDLLVNTTAAPPPPTLDPLEPWWNSTANGTYYGHPRHVRPGFKARITQKGLNYATRFAADFLTTQLTKLQIPNIEENIATAKVRVIDVTVVDFPKPRNRLSIVPGRGLRWQVWNMEPTFSAIYGAVIGLGFFSITKEGNVTVNGRRMKFDVDFVIERDPENNRPFLLSTECKAEGSVQIQFEGGWSEMLNAGSTVLQSFIQSTIMDQICQQAKTEIDINMQSEMHTLPMRERVANLFDLDFTFTHFPTFNKRFIETSHSGTTYYAADPQEPLFKPPKIPPFRKHTKRMMYMYITDYLVNSGLHAGFTSGQMTYNVTRDVTDKLPSEAVSILKFNCAKKDICLGSVYPQLATSYPRHMMAEVDIYATNAPTVHFLGGNKAVLSTFSEAVFYVTDGNRVHLFTAEMNATSAVVVKVNGSIISFDIKDIEPQGFIKETNIGDTTQGFAFDQLLKKGIEKFVMQKIAVIAKTGFELPSTEDAKFEKSQIIRVRNKGLLVVATDIHINPHMDIQAMIDKAQSAAQTIVSDQAET